MKAKKVVLIVVLAIVALIVLQVMTGPSDSGEKTQDKAQAVEQVETEKTKDPEKTEDVEVAEVEENEETEEVSEDIPTVYVGDMIAEFEANEARGNKTYKDKELYVTGIVSSVDHTNIGEERYSLNLDTGADFELVSLRVNAPMEFEDELINLDVGQEIKIHIKCKGFVAGLYVDGDLLEIIQ